jgi:hypothetical protein
MWWLQEMYATGRMPPEVAAAHYALTKPPIKPEAP